jgi:hypothetical protein
MGLLYFVFTSSFILILQTAFFLTERLFVNSLFAPIAELNIITRGDKQKQDGIKTVLSNWVGAAGRLSNQYIEDLKEIQRIKHIINCYS